MKNLPINLNKSNFYAFDHYKGTFLLIKYVRIDILFLGTSHFYQIIKEILEIYINIEHPLNPDEMAIFQNF